MRVSSCRLIVDPPASGAWNMAVDEVLLDAATQGGECCLRFYQWSSPTLSLGYFQWAGARVEHPASLQCDLVRRSTGGGAILHDLELTYSLVVGAEHPLAADPGRLYDRVHTALIDTLGELGIAAGLCRGGRRYKPDDKPFLCFQRHSAGDVLLEGVKIAGSAQRKRRGAILQHGSVLLGTSEHAPELKGLEELSEKRVSVDQVVQIWTKYLAKSLNVAWHMRPLAENERDAVRAMVAKKFGWAKWTNRK